MVRKSLFFLILTFAATYGQAEVLPGAGLYDTLVHLAAVDSRVQEDPYVPICSREYYESIIEDASERRWAFPFAFNYILESRHFTCDGCKQSIGCALFGQETALRDIFLPARISEQDKMYIQTGAVRGATRPLPSPSGVQFGQFTDEQYLSLIAPAKIGACASRHAIDCNFSGMYRFKLFSKKRIFGIVGFNLPVRIEVRSIDLNSYDGSLFTFGFAANQTIRETTLSQFFKDFTSIEDFFIRAVLGSKGITFDPNQQRIGVGDISLFGILEYGPFFTEFSNGFCCSLDALQFGIDVSVPSASKCLNNKLWEIDFGNGGGYQITFFTSSHFRTELNAINPFYNVGIEFHPKFCATKCKGNGIRIPRVVTHTDNQERLINDSNIVLPVINGTTLFGEFFADDFSELDTMQSIFADKVPNATVKIGRRIFFGIGNYFYNLFGTRLRAGIFYNYSTKKPDCFCIKDASFDTSSLSFKSKSHRIGWNITYQSEGSVEVGFGSQHILTGCNVPEQHEIFASLVVSF